MGSMTHYTDFESWKVKKALSIAEMRFSYKFLDNLKIIKLYLHSMYIKFHLMVCKKMRYSRHPKERPVYADGGH